MAQNLEELQFEIEQRLEKLTPKQRRFALAYEKGANSQMEAAKTAGYSVRTLKNSATNVYKRTKDVITLIQRKQSLELGDPVSAHRSRLLNLFDLCADSDSETWEPRTAHSIARTLLEIDGHIKGDAKSAAEISIKIVDPVAGFTIEHEGNQEVSGEGVKPALTGDVQALPTKSG